MVRTPQVGDIYLFRGLANGPEADGRKAHIKSITMGGKLIFQISFMGEISKEMHSANLSDAFAMIAHNVWELQEY